MNELLQNPQLNIPVVNGSAFIPSDFRIGNYVQSKEWKGIAQIEGIEVLQDRIDFKVKGYIHAVIKGKYFDLEPIKITDELLFSLGFYTDGKFRIYVSGNFEFRLRLNSITGEYMCDFPNWIFSVKYLHRLQNLIHNLSGRDVVLS
ncbi:MAG: hypothetical protein JW870_09530 [Candidatus Delongbacteria bacterium]|nr:hypothetical protein [Candidatus Delongbacteria bacterium]